MYKVAMYNTIKTLLEHGKSLREISRELGMCRKTVSRIQKALLNGDSAPRQQSRSSGLEVFHEQIEHYLASGLSALLIHQKLIQQHGLTLSYSSVARYIGKFKRAECFVPLHSLPGEEAQVDFGYFGEFRRNGRGVKVWVFSMVLSHSRQSYYKVVTSQQVREFLDCHISAFEYFGGVPKMVELDNLRSGVTKVDLYEPTLQAQYAEFLSYYHCAGIACRPRRPTDKGKVESSIKYVRNNFLKAFESKSYEDLICGLRVWNDEICNKRVHGTTRRRPHYIFLESEKAALQPLPSRRFQIQDVSHRRVNRMGHVAYKQNYYSVPADYMGMNVRLESNGTILRIYDSSRQIAMHQLSDSIGMFVSLAAHRPREKRMVSKEEYREMMGQIGPNAYTLFDRLVEEVPTHWGKMTQGILALRKRFTLGQIERSCARALHFHAISYQQVKRICENAMYDLPREDVLTMGFSDEFQHELSYYDTLTN